jgi:membrane protein required for beta-lactamase induction
VAYHLGAGVTHSWLRALLSYHSPALALHLDRVLPHWQEAAAEISAHQVISRRGR